MLDPHSLMPCHHPVAASGSTRTPRMCETGNSRLLRSAHILSIPSTSKRMRSAAVMIVTMLVNFNLMTLFRSSILLLRLTAVTFALVATATPLSAQGIVDMVVPHEGVNAETAAYHAKVREKIGSVLQTWARAIERQDSVALAANYTANARSIIGREPEGITPLGIVTQIFSTGLGGAHLDVTVEDFDM